MVRPQEHRVHTLAGPSLRQGLAVPNEIADRQDGSEAGQGTGAYATQFALAHHQVGRHPIMRHGAGIDEQARHRARRADLGDVEEWPSAGHDHVRRSVVRQIVPVIGQPAHCRCLRAMQIESPEVRHFSEDRWDRRDRGLVAALTEEGYPMPSLRQAAAEQQQQPIDTEARQQSLIADDNMEGAGCHDATAGVTRAYRSGGLLALSSDAAAAQPRLSRRSAVASCGRRASTSMASRKLL